MRIRGLGRKERKGRMVWNGKAHREGTKDTKGSDG